MRDASMCESEACCESKMADMASCAMERTAALSASLAHHFKLEPFSTVVERSLAMLEAAYAATPMPPVDTT